MTKPQLKARCEDVIANPQDHLDWVVDMARVALSSLEAVPVYQLIDDGYWWDAPKYLFDEAKERGEQHRVVYPAPPVPDLTLNAELYAELYRLREEVKGPDAFQTWKDAAVFERKRRVAMKSLANEINYLGAMGAFHSDKWHKMVPITGYMHGWNACIAETKRLNGVKS